MIVFETNLSKSEVTERFLSTVTLLDNNPCSCTPRIFMEVCPRGNIHNSYFWFDFSQTHLNGLSYLFRSDILFLLPRHHELRGELMEMKNGTKITGKFCNHFISNSIIGGLVLFFLIINLMGYCTAANLTDYVLEAFISIFIAVFFGITIKTRRKWYAQDEAHMIQYLEILWNATVRKE